MQLRRAGHPLGVDVPFTREPEQRLEHVHKALARRNLDAHDGVRVSFICRGRVLCHIPGSMCAL